jgi:hypothetical protein
MYSNCTQFEDPHKLAEKCRSADRRDEYHVLNCLKQLYFLDFRKTHWIRVVEEDVLYSRDEQLEIAFGRGSTLFYYQLKNFGWLDKEKSATVKTALFRYCDFQLMELTQFIYRNKQRLCTVDPQFLIDEIDYSYWKYQEWKKKREQILYDAIARLDQKCIDCILWRKLKVMTDEDIKIKYGRVTDQVIYKCVEKLKKLKDKIEEELNEIS